MRFLPPCFRRPGCRCPHGAPIRSTFARDAILAPAALDENRVAGVLGEVMGHAVDYADLYFQPVREESWSLEDGIVKDGTHSIEQGVGVRALAGEKTGFAYSDEVVLPALLEAARAARAIARSGQTGSLQAWHASGGRGLYLPIDPIDTLDDRDKVRAARGDRPRGARARSAHQQVMASLAATHETMLVLASDGTLAADVRPLVRLNVSVIVEHEGRREQGYAGGGGRFAYTEFLETEPLAAARASEAVRTAQVNLEAVPAPAGTMTVVLGSGLARRAAARGGRPRARGRLQPQGHVGVHGRIGEQVASPLCTVVDDGTLVAAPRLAQHRRRRHADAVHDADRERRAARLPAGQAQRAADGRRRRPAMAVASPSRT